MLELLGELSFNGWLVNNLFQHDNGTWQCNLRRPDPTNDGDWITDFAFANTIELALETVMTTMAQAEFVANKKVSGIIDRSTPSLLKTLGLARPAPTFIPRRI